MKRKENSFDVAVVGAGISGLSVAWHLEKQNRFRIALIAPQDDPSITAKSAGLVAAGLNDNFTRYSHTFGTETATKIWRFSHTAFTKLGDFCRESGLAFHKGERLRLVVSQPELKETKAACQELNEAGFDVRLVSDQLSKAPYAAQLTKRVLAVQDEGETAGFLDPRDLLKALRARLKAPLINGRVLSTTENQDHVALNLESGSSIASEVVVFCQHLDIRRCLPNLSEALIPVIEQWATIECSRNDEFWRQAGHYFSAHHGYEWGVTTGIQSIHFGGGRFLRKFAGIGAEEPSIDDKIERYLPEQLSKTFSWARAPKSLRSEVGLECRPCDELPLIGPMFGGHRILLATGFMGQGLTLGFMAGYCLAELITNGRSLELPDFLWPSRLRSGI